ncbi:MAG: HNH endonuclease [Comamonadaceae bacterium]|nr:MAG: HNH endonuclease [Comamonadaceae bacterium]
MSTETIVRLEPPAASLWSAEWWERARDRRIAWAQRHARVVKRLLVARLIVAAVLLVYVAVVCILVPAFREAVAVYVGVAWIMLVGFVMMRTKTLTFGGGTCASSRSASRGRSVSPAATTSCRRRSSGYTWHHVEDGHTLQLVPSDIHAAVRHTGGIAVLK